MTQPTAPGEVSRVGTAPVHRTLLTAAALLVLALAAAGAVVPGRAGEWFDAAAVALVVATPLLRVAVVGVELARERDWRFAAAAGALVAIVAFGALLA